MASNFAGVQPIKVVKRFSQRQKKRIDVPQPYCFMKYNQRMSGVDFLDCFISQYRPNIIAKKWYHPPFLNSINTICIVGWRLQVILQCDPQKDHLDFIRSVEIGLLRNPVRPETARTPKSGQQINCKQKYWAAPAS